MSRRRLDREQQKNDFLQQFQELITFNTRIEVVELEGEDDHFACENNGLVETLDGEDDTFFDLEATVDGEPSFIDTDIEEVAQDFTLIDDAYGPGFEIDSSADEGEEDAYLVLSENGIGVASEDEIDTAFGEDEEFVVPAFIGEDEGGVPDGFDTISEGEVFEMEVFGEDFYGEDEDGGVSFGIDFTATGRGSVEITLYGEDVVTETFDLPFGNSGPLNFEVDAPEGFVFSDAEVTVTGSAEISIVGVDLETNFDPAGLPV